MFMFEREKEKQLAAIKRWTDREKHILEMSFLTFYSKFIAITFNNLNFFY